MNHNHTHQPAPEAGAFEFKGWRMKDHRYEIHMLIEAIERRGNMSGDVRRLADIAIELAKSEA